MGGSEQLLCGLDRQRTLFIVPCSAAKRAGGNHAAAMGIMDELPNDVRRKLQAARKEAGSRAQVDETALLPAWQRYAGSFYQAAGPTMARAMAEGMHLLILSGGYGVVLPTEPIGVYNAVFDKANWSVELLERVTGAYVHRHSLTAMTAFLSASTAYAKQVAAIRWHHLGVASAFLVSPVAGGKRPAQILVPRAGGEAFATFVAGELPEGWSSSDGLGLRVTSLA